MNEQERAAAIIMATLSQDVDTGMGGTEPLTEVYRPEGVGLVIAQALADAGLIVTDKLNDVVSTAVEWRGRFGKLLNQGCDCKDCVLMGNLTVAVDALTAAA